MANRRFIDFPIASTVGDNDIILIWQDGLNKQTTKATLLSGLPEDLADLNDVVISELTNGQILRYNSTTGVWENTDQGNLDLNDLNDVTIVSPSNGQVLVYNSSTSKWENSSGGYVPYTGAVTTVNLGSQQLIAGQTTLTTNGSADTLTINHTSGSGKAINVTKGGNNEGLYINKTSGSGNAATIVGTLEATTLVKTGGTSSQFLKADGSVDSTTYVPSTRNITINGTTQDLSADRTYNVGTVTSVGLSSATSGVTIGSTPVTTSGTITLAIATASGSQNGLLSSTDWTTFNNKQNALNNPVTGTGTTNYLPKFTGASTIGNSQIFDNGTSVGIGTASPNATLSLYATGTPYMNFRNDTNISSTFGFVIEATGNNSELWNYANGYMRFGTNNVETIRLSNSNNLLVGTTTDNGAKLQVSGTATSSGPVGIGTSSPTLGMLHLLSSSNTTQIRLGGTTAPGFVYANETNSSFEISSGRDGTAGTFPNTSIASSIISLNSLNSNSFITFLTSTTNNVGPTERMRITSSGEVLIGNTDNGAYNLQCNGTGVWGAGAYVNGSDRNIKDNISTIEKGLKYILKINPVKFRYKPNYTRDHSMQTGFIAQELQEVFASEDYLSGLVQQGVHLSVAYQNLLPVLVKAIQELKQEIDTLKN